jgi:hypothetical protein
MSKTRIAKYIPADTNRGFHDGRKLGNRAVEKVPYGVGLTTGIGFGIVEGIVGALAAPTNCLIGLGTRAIRAVGVGCRAAHDE